MRHETASYIGDIDTPRGARAKNTAPENRKVYPEPETNQRCGRNRKGQKTASTAPNVADGFLRCSFLPKLSKTEVGRNMENAVKEGEFYNSLSLLHAHYGIRILDSQHFAYPYNLALALAVTEKQLREKCDTGVYLDTIQNDDGRLQISVCETYDTGTTLYYIPVVPLYRLLRKYKNCGQLLLCVFSYLYHIAWIPYYRHDCTFIYWQYEMIRECEEMELEESETNDFSLINEFNTAFTIGNIIERKILNPVVLQQFEAKMNSFVVKTDFERHCYEIAKEAFAIYSDFPERSIFCHLNNTADTEEMVTMDRYISFVSDTEGGLFERLEECVNCEFGNYSSMQEPEITNLFPDDQMNKTADNLDFERRIFPLIEKLCFLLNNI